MDLSFGRWVKLRRKALDFTQENLAQKIGCSISLIYKIEADERRPSQQIAALLAKHLEIPKDQHSQFMKVARREKSVSGLSVISAPLDPISAERSPQRKKHLPVFPTPLVGRENEMDQIISNLQDPYCRMLTLTGPGGVGKTRLAVEAAHRMGTMFPDGIYFLPMAGISLTESIIPAIADEFSLVFSGPVDPKTQVFHSLREKKVLLVFDNLEHLIDCGSLLIELLQEAPEIKLLVTSREQLHLQWEWVFDISGLPVPENVDVGDIEANSAAALFIQRARQALKAFSPDEKDFQAILQICKLMEGLPLAIEMAASWVRYLPCPQIALKLEKDLDFLETTMHDLPGRHRSLKAVFDHSWKLLSDDERSVLMRLSIFHAGFSRQAANDIAGASLSLLSSLVGKSLLRYSPKTDRYDLHEIIRYYANSMLVENPAEAAQTREKFSTYFAHWLADQETSLKSADQIHTSFAIRTETPHWYTAWQWAVQNRELRLVRLMIPCLYWYYEVHGYYAEALQTMNYAKSELLDSGEPINLLSPQEKSTTAFILDQLGWFEFRTGNNVKAKLLFSESLALAGELNDPEVLYHIHGNWGYSALIEGDMEMARRLTLDSLSDAYQLHSSWHIAIPKNVLGILEFLSGNLEKAYQQLTESLEIWRGVGDPRGLVFCMLYLGSTALALGNLNLAREILRESNTISENKRDWWAQAFGLDLLGQVCISEFQYQPAIDLLEQSISLFQKIGDLFGSAKTTIHLGLALGLLNSKEKAKLLLLNAYTSAVEAKWAPLIDEVLVAYTAIETEISPETKLAILQSVLSHSSAPAHVRAQAERLRSRLPLTVKTMQADPQETFASQKEPETWAHDIFHSMIQSSEHLS